MTRFFLLFPIAGLIAGCGPGGPPVFPVTGEVVYADDSTFSNGGRVLFSSINLDPPVAGKGYLDTEGKFQLTQFKRGANFVKGSGIEAGEYEVAVLPFIPDVRGTLTQAQFDRARHPLEDRFKKPKTSGLRFTVSAESEKNHFRIVVQ